MRIALLTALLTVWTCSVAAATPVTDLRDAVAARLLLMEEVARYKWNAQLPITAPEREAALLDRATAAAVEIDIPGDYARQVIAAQIEASRTMQAALFESWQAAHDGPFGDVPDLTTVQRPRIDRATTQLLHALARARCTLQTDDARRRLSAAPAPLARFTAAWQIATAALFSPTACL
jgi:chorismate mutase-like protein